VVLLLLLSGTTIVFTLCAQLLRLKATVFRDGVSVERTLDASKMHFKREVHIIDFLKQKGAAMQSAMVQGRTEEERREDKRRRVDGRVGAAVPEGAPTLEAATHATGATASEVPPLSTAPLALITAAQPPVVNQELHASSPPAPPPAVATETTAGAVGAAAADGDKDGQDEEGSEAEGTETGMCSGCGAERHRGAASKRCIVFLKSGFLPRKKRETAISQANEWWRSIGAAE